MGAIYVIGAGPLGLNTLRWARECGLHVIATDRNPKAPGFAFSDESHAIDGTDVEAHLACARASREPVVGVLCGAEFAARTVQRLREALGLEANDAATIERVLDKRAMKRAFLEADVPTPALFEVRNPDELRALARAEGAPLVIKPAGGSGSRGVRLVDASTDLEEAFGKSLASVEGETRILAEPFHAGRSIDANGLFLDGELHACGVLEKWSTPFPDFLPVGGCDPAELPREEREAVIALLERACRAVGLRAGPVKGDFLRTETGYVVLEVAPRFHGDVTTCNTLPFGSRINPLRFWFRRLATGETDLAELAPEREAYATWRVLCLPPGRVESLADPASILPFGSITKLWHNPRIADRIPRYTDTTKIPGYVCAWGDDRAQAEETIAAWLEVAGYRVDPDPAHAAWYERLRARLDALGLGGALRRTAA